MAIYRRTTQTRIGQVIANRQTLENKSVLKEMGWLRLPELLAGEGSSGAEWYVILPWMGWWLCCVEWTSRAGRLRNRVSIPGVAKYLSVNFIFMDPCIVDDSVEIPTRCSFVIEFIIPKFFFFWRLNMFQAAYRSSSGALNCICSLWFIYPCGDRPLPRLSGKWIHFALGLSNGRSPHVYINQRLQIKFRDPDDERCASRNMLSLQYTLE